MILLVMISQTLVYREVTALFNIPGRPSVTSSGSRKGSKSAMSSQVTSAQVSEDEDAEDEDGITRGEGRRREELWSKTLSWSVWSLLIVRGKRLDFDFLITNFFQIFPEILSPFFSLFSFTGISSLSPTTSFTENL